MKIATFELERYFAEHEFTARHLLSSSDCEALSLSELLGLADPETARLWQELRLGYTQSPGHPLLRQAIAALYDGCSADDVQVVVPEEGIFLLAHALLEPGDHVVCTFPAYQSLHEVARSIGCTVTYWRPDEGPGWRFDLDRLADCLEDRTRLLVVNFPHNPTGALPSPGEQAAIVDLARQRGLYLLSDEMYRFLEHDRDRPLPAGCETYGRAITLAGLSKGFGLAGLRLGWLATRDRSLLREVARLKDYTTICHSAPSEILGLVALRAGETILTRQRERLRANLELLDDFFDRHQDLLAWTRPAGGSVALARVLAVADTDVFCRELLAESGILVAPSSLFGFGRRHVRIGFGRADLPDLIPILAEHLDRRFRVGGPPSPLTDSAATD